MRFLVAGRGGGALVESRAEAFETMVDARRPLEVRLWQARRWHKRLAAAMILENAGKTGFLFYSPPAANGVDSPALVRVIRTASQDAIARGLSLTQSLVAPDARDDIGILRSAGYELLAELDYMRLNLDSQSPADDPADLTWRTYGQFDEGELSELIVATYAGSLDCPRLSGVRPIGDVIAGHKATGLFRPESWWIVSCSGSPAGCILVNDSSTSPAAEVVYMGVAPAQRGKGIARRMLRKAAAAARHRGRAALTLAVDAANVHARGVYEAEGFQPVDRRFAYAMIQPTGSGERKC